MLAVVALALFDGAGRVLMQRRPEGRQHGGLWEFPGGKIEPGEGPVGALVRESVEELGLALDPAGLFPITFAASENPGQRPVALLLYGSRQPSGVLQGEDGAELAWVDRSRLAALAMPPLDVPLAAAIVPLLK